jgi:hypothetical protein
MIFMLPCLHCMYEYPLKPWSLVPTRYLGTVHEAACFHLNSTVYPVQVKRYNLPLLTIISVVSSCLDH